MNKFAKVAFIIVNILALASTIFICLLFFSISQNGGIPVTANASQDTLFVIIWGFIISATLVIDCITIL